MKKRLFLLTILALIGGFLFVPFNYGTFELSVKDWVMFPLSSAIVILILGWLGLMLSDKAQLPMPILRKWENNEKIEQNDWKILLIPALLGAVFALILVGLNQYFNPPKNPGSFLVRILTTPWAALIPETITHLLFMSALVLLLKNKWLSIIISSLIFVALFHINNVEEDLQITIYMTSMNFVGSTLTGWFYSKYGFESAVIGHATMHLILLAIN